MKRFVPICFSLAFIAVLGFGCVSASQKKTAPAVIDRSSILLDAKKQGLIMDTPEIEHMKDPAARVQDAKKIVLKDLKSYQTLDVKTWHAAALADVTGGGSFGLAHTSNQNGHFTLIAVLGGLPVLSNGSHYEGWLVKRGDGMSVVDLGSATALGDQYMSVYESNTDFSSYDFYVLTIETGDASSGPSEHVLEGVIR